MEAVIEVLLSKTKAEDKLKDDKLSETDKETIIEQKQSLTKTDEVLDEVANLKPGEDCTEPTGMIRDENWNPYQSEVYWASNNAEEILRYVYEKISQARPFCALKIEKALEGVKNAGGDNIKIP
jgi:hypothetical protein